MLAAVASHPMNEDSPQPAIASPESPGTGSTDRGRDEIRMLDLMVIIAENARLLVFGPILAGLVALGLAFLISPVFTATTLILPPQQQQGAAAMLATQLGALSGVAGAAGMNIRNPSDTYLALIK